MNSILILIDITKWININGLKFIKDSCVVLKCMARKYFVRGIYRPRGALLRVLIVVIGRKRTYRRLFNAHIILSSQILLGLNSICLLIKIDQRNGYEDTIFRSLT